MDLKTIALKCAAGFARVTPKEVLWLFYVVFPVVVVLWLLSWASPSIHHFIGQMGLLHPLAGWLHILAVVVLVIGFTILSFATMTSFSNLIKPFKSKQFFWELMVYYPIWGTVQQLIFFTLLAMVRNIWDISNYWSYVLLGAMFILFHFPNRNTMFSGGFMILIFAHHMDLYHNIFAVGIAHGIIGVFYDHFAPKWVSTDFSIWGRYIEAQRRMP